MNDAPADRLERERAILSDRNVVVTAGAGTGKTTLLVDRMVHLIVREPLPIKVTDLVALTFTKKAAGEMKARLRAALQALRPGGHPQSEFSAREEVLRRCALPASIVDARIGTALRELDRAHIGTIHGFAATLLRLYPLEAGVDPAFEEADEPAWCEHVERVWREWLARELAADAPRAELWRRLLSRLDVAAIGEAAFALCAEGIPLGGERDGTPCPGFDRWCREQADEAERLAVAHPGARKIERQTAAARRVFEDLAVGRAPAPSPEEAALVASDPNQAPSGWDREDFRRAKGLVALAARMLSVDEETVGLLGRVVEPFIVECRLKFTRSGRVSFDGLLVRARDVLRDRTDVREALKRRFRAVLIDEFQDTDPLQYEILLYLSEAPGRSAGHWTGVTLEAGKLFIVGDPKQSIYGFRGADIEAYQQVVQVVLDQGGLSCTLGTNFRSHARILDAVNGICSRLIAFDAGRQPAYDPIEAAAGSPDGPKPILRVIKSSREPFDAERARAAEAESLARWLAEEVLGRMTIADRAGRERAAAAGDVAILMRALTDVHILLDALRRRNIPYVVEGERHFFATQDVVDAVNVLRAVADPEDALALVGVLRSPLGAVTDRDLEQLAHEGRLDSRARERAGDASTAAPLMLYGELAALQREVAVLPVARAVERVFERLPLESLAAAGLDGDQAVANLEKLRRLAGTLADDGARSFPTVVRLLEQRIREETEEAESPLADEHLDAVKVMSIHKAKGLEFPVVILAAAHANHEVKRPSVIARHPSSGRVGLCAAGATSLAGIYFDDRRVRRETAEYRRLLYVAMTRARHMLVISGAPTGRLTGESLLTLAEGAWDVEPTLMDRVEALAEPAAPAVGPPGRPGPDALDAARYRETWRARRERCARAMGAPRILTPTLLSREAASSYPVRQGARVASADGARRVGTLVHAFLQRWSFDAEVSSWPAALDGFPAAADASMDERDQASRVLAPFFASAAYREIAASTILGREVPLIMPWEDGIMEGVIDLIYEDRGSLYVADYKSDAIEPPEAGAAAERYRPQAAVYTRAVREAFGRPAVFRCVFLRLGLAIELADV
ncbi:MAG: UvrD-helicase domain-containing protein [Nitrospiria bacterium]